MTPRGALISTCGRFRPLLWRIWGLGSYVLFVMLNPSTANAELDDNTIKKLNWFASNLGFQGFYVVNLFDYRATDPKDLAAAGWPISESCDRWLVNTLPNVSAVICGWGANARRQPTRAADVLATIRLYHQPLALRLLADGVPEHPLYLPSGCRPVML